MIDMKRISKFLAIGLIFISIFIITMALKQTSTIIRLIGVIGGIIVIIVESAFLLNFIKR